MKRSIKIPQEISHTPWLISALYKEVNFLLPFDSVHTRYGEVSGGSVENIPKEEYEYRVLSATDSWAHNIMSYSDQALERALANGQGYKVITGRPRYQINKFEFIAKVLRYSDYRPNKSTEKVLLGTPIYVSKVD